MCIDNITFAVSIFKNFGTKKQKYYVVWEGNVPGILLHEYVRTNQRASI